jgi:hypothetical protein
VGCVGEQTIYQQMLPDDLQQEEAVQVWTKDPTIREALRRLAGCRPVEISRAQGRELFG